MRLPQLALPDLVGPLVAAGALLALVPLGVAAGLIGGATALVACVRSRQTAAVAGVGLVLLGWGCGALRVHELGSDPLAPQVGHALEVVLQVAVRFRIAHGAGHVICEHTRVGLERAARMPPVVNDMCRPHMVV